MCWPSPPTMLAIDAATAVSARVDAAPMAMPIIRFSSASPNLVAAARRAQRARRQRVDVKSSSTGAVAPSNGASPP